MSLFNPWGNPATIVCLGPIFFPAGVRLPRASCVSFSRVLFFARTCSRRSPVRAPAARLGAPAAGRIPWSVNDVSMDQRRGYLSFSKRCGRFARHGKTGGQAARLGKA